MSLPASPEKLGTPAASDANGETKEASCGGNDEGALREECQVYRFRWVVLILFVVYSMSNAFQWIQFAIINGLVGQFYG